MSQSPSNRDASLTRPTGTSRPGSPESQDSSEIAGRSPITIRQTLAGMQQAWDMLAAQRADIDARLNRIAAAMEEIRQLGDAESPTPRGGEQRKRVTDAIEQILRGEQPLHRQNILARLETKGIYVGGANPINSLSAYLSQDDRFVSVGRGQWSLAETDDTSETEEGADS